MIRQIKLLTKTQLCNFMDLNVFRFTKDKKKKRSALSMGLLWLLLITILCLYVGTFAYGYSKMGLGQVIPMYLIMISALLILVFGIFKAGSVIFQRNFYEILCALPVSQTAVVISRFFSMYLGNVILSVAVMIPGMAVYAYFNHPGISFYAVGTVGTLFIPLLPMTVATLLGALVTGIASRMKHKSLVTTVLSILLIVGIMMFSQMLAGVGETFTEEMFADLLETLTTMIARIYPPALWLGNAMTEGNVLQGGLYFGVSIAVFVVMVILIAGHFKSICENLYSTSAKHDYRMTEMKRNTVLTALFRKEVKRYFASSIYTVNTIVGPIMMVILAAAILLTGVDKIESVIPLQNGIIGLMPFVLATTSCIMTTTSTSISLEGKEWWILQSLPVDAKTVFDSKILLNLAIVAPFYVIAEVLIILALTPSFVELVWLIFLPIIYMLFTFVFGITVNLHMPVLHWENEVAVVKQSASAMVGGLGGCLIIILCAVPVVFVTGIVGEIVKAVTAIVILAITVLLYKTNAKTALSHIE